MTLPPDYAAIKAINASAIKAGTRSMLHMHHALTASRDESTAMRWGSLVHDYVLLGPSNFAVFPGPRKAGKVWDEFELLNMDKNIVKADELAELEAVRDRIRWNPDAEAALFEDGVMHEKSLTWEEPGIGPCKGRIDCFAPASGSLLDLKNAKDIGERAFTLASWSAGTHLQMAWYRRGLRANGHAVKRAGIVAIESAAPWDVALYWYDEPLLAWAEKECIRICQEYKKAEKLGLFPGAQKFPTTILQPAFADEMIQGLPEDDGDPSEL